MDADLVAAHGRLPSLMPFLHLPVQSGADRILRAMNRGHDAGSTSPWSTGCAPARPDLALSSDFIVGHPGETDADFEATLALVRQVGFAQSFSFKYSQRPGTPAASAAGQVPEPVKDERLARLQALIRQQQDEFNRRAAKATPDAGADDGARGGSRDRSPDARPILQPVHAARSPAHADRHRDPRVYRRR